jgi:hypothetical protein
MGKETSISKEIIADFKKMAGEIENIYQISLQLAEIYGSRWSYVAGSINNNQVNLPPTKLKLSDTIGVLVYGLVYGEPALEEIKNRLMRLVK